MKKKKNDSAKCQDQLAGGRLEACPNIFGGRLAITEKGAGIGKLVLCAF